MKKERKRERKYNEGFTPPKDKKIQIWNMQQENKIKEN